MIKSKDSVSLRMGPVPYELIEALEEYMERRPERGEVKVHSCLGTIQMKDISNEIRKGSKIGIDYEKALYKMAFEDLLDGRKKL